MKTQIIAIGGGGFGRNPKHNKIEKYIIAQSKKEKPNILFIPTASAEDKSYIINFYSCFSKLRCTPSHLTFFQRTPKLDGLINQADIIYVGGGNTKSMLAVWREWKLDKLLLKAYNSGKILSGVSAGAICWFEQGITDSWASNLNTLDCLGFVNGMGCPHYQEEPERRPDLHKLLKNGKAIPGYAIDGGAAAHFIDGIFYRGLQFYPNSFVYSISQKDGFVKESRLDMKSL